MNVVDFALQKILTSILKTLDKEIKIKIFSQKIVRKYIYLIVPDQKVTVGAFKCGGLSGG